MKQFAILFAVLTLMVGHTFAQGTRQISSRKIKSIETRTLETKKGKPTLTHIISTYDKKGRLIQEVKLDSSGVCVVTETNKYNRKDDLIEHVVYQGNSTTILEKTEIQYDKFGRDTLKIEYDQNGLKSKTSYTYDNFDNRITETMIDANGKIVRSVSMQYDKRGMLLSRIIKNENGDVIYEKTNAYTY